jgi:hypothetical protein
MAGVFTHPPGHAPRRARHAVALLAAALGLCLLLLVGSSASPVDASAAKASQECPPQPFGLAPPPTTPAPQRFTMMIRINTQGNVDTYTKPQQGMGDRIRPQDIFVLNTRFTGSGQFPAMTASVAAGLTAQLRAAFPCNRIIDLNGLSLDPAQPGYAFTGIDDPNTFALLTDFELADWNASRLTVPGRPPWTDDFAAALPQIKGWDFTLASTAAANPIGVGKRTGLAPQDNGTWNFGQVAQDLNKKNLRLGTKLGPLSVQTQESCASGGAAGFGARAKQLRLQYTFKFITKKVRVKGKKKKVKKTFREPLKKKARPILDNLAMQVSHTDVTDSSSSMALLRTSAALAASCVGPAMKQGIGAFFFFASDDAMRLLFQQPQIAAFRPPTATTTGSSANSGGVGAPGLN